MNKEIWYLVSDCGDGTAYPVFYESEDATLLADEYLQRLNSNFAEICNGVLRLESDTEIRVDKTIHTFQSVVDKFVRYYDNRLSDGKLTDDDYDDIIELTKTYNTNMSDVLIEIWESENPEAAEKLKELERERDTEQG